MLPLIDLSEVNPVHNSTPCPFLFHFKKGAQIGLFCTMIVHLLSLTHHGRSLWVNDESDSKIFSNFITLRRIGGRKVDFVEDHNVFKIHYEFTKDLVKVKKELIRAINETITTRRIIKEMQTEVGFIVHVKWKADMLLPSGKKTNGLFIVHVKKMLHIILQKTVLILVGLSLSPLMMVCAVYLLYTKCLHIVLYRSDNDV